MRAALLAIVAATIGSAQVDERCPGTSLERSPTLLGSWQRLKEAARNEGVQDRLVFQLTVTDTGGVRDPVITAPRRVTGSEKIKDELLKLRFCPAVKYSRYVELRGTFDIEISSRYSPAP